jgi:hypothetical protein
MTVIEIPPTHAEAAHRLLENLRVMQGSIGGFVIPPSPLDRQARLRGHRQYPDPFFVSLAVGIESSPTLTAAMQATTIGLTPGEIRDMLRYGEAYLPLANELERFARGIRHTVGLRRAKVGRLAASVYAIAKGLNLLVDVSPPVPEVDSMRRAFTARRRRTAEQLPAGTKAST